MRTNWMPADDPHHGPFKTGHFTCHIDMIDVDDASVMTDLHVEAEQDEAGGYTITTAQIRFTRPKASGGIGFETAYKPAAAWLLEAARAWASTRAGEDHLSDAAQEAGL